MELGVKRLGREELATRLRTTPELLDAWRYGHATMPDRKVLALIDLVDSLGALGDEA